MRPEKGLRHKIHSYLDQTFFQHQQLLLLAELCVASAHADMIDGETVEALGVAIRSYVERHRALQHLFLDSDTPRIFKSVLAAERARLEAEGHEFLSTNDNAEGENEDGET